MALSKFLKIEDGMPEWLDKPKVQWIPWGYAVWQVFRTNPLVLCLVSFLPFWFYQILYWIMEENTRHVVALVPGEEKLPLDDAELYISNNKKKMADLGLELIEKRPSNVSNDQRPGNDSNDEIPREWKLPDDWKVVKYKSKIYFTNLTSLAQTIACLREQQDNNRKIIFVENMQPLTTTWAVGKYIQEEDAMEKMLSGDYVIDTDYNVIACYINYTDVRTKLWGVLGTLPTLMQAWKFNKTSVLVTLLIILLDMNRVWLYDVYDRFFNLVTRWLKRKCFKDRVTWYHFMSVFSNRWIFTDRERGCSYEAYKGKEIVLHPFSKIRNLNDLTIHGTSHYDVNKYAIRLWEDDNIFRVIFPHIMFGEDLTNLASYCSGGVSKCLKSFYKKKHERCGKQLRGGICSSCYGREREEERGQVSKCLEFFYKKIPESCGIKFCGGICCSCYGTEREEETEKNNSYKYRGIGAKMMPGRTYAIATLNRIAFVE